MEHLKKLALDCTHRGDQPSQILPRLYLSGHPARFNSGAARACATNPSAYLRATHKVKLIVNCCAGKSLSAGVVEDVRNGDKRAIATVEELLEIIRASSDNRNEHEMFHLLLPLDDVPEFDILPYLMPACMCIEQCLARDEQNASSVAVFCQMGVSRSASIVTAFLMANCWKKHNAVLSSEEAIDFVQSRRCQVDPNEGFREKLVLFEKMVRAENNGGNERKEGEGEEKER